MNENLNLCEILKNVPTGTKLYSPLFGEVEFKNITSDPWIVVSTSGKFNGDFYSDGKYYGSFDDAECMLFPSKDQRDWSKFEVPAQKVKVTLHPFDKVLVRDDASQKWLCILFSHKEKDMDYTYPYGTNAGYFLCCIPYNEQTKHLVGTTDECPIEYDIEFKK